MLHCLTYTQSEYVNWKTNLDHTPNIHFECQKGLVIDSNINILLGITVYCLEGESEVYVEKIPVAEFNGMWVENWL